MKTANEVKAALMKLIADTSDKIYHGHDVYSKNEVGEMLNNLSSEIFAMEVEEADDTLYSVTAIKEAIDHMFGDWDFDEYIDVSIDHNRKIEVEFDERTFRRDAVANITLSLDDEH